MSSRKAVLGRGLNALIPTDDRGAAAPRAAAEAGSAKLYHIEDRMRLAGRVADIDVEHIRPNPYQPRRDFDEAALDELAASIVQLGVIQPITVRTVEAGRYEIISGERRLRAARRAGLQQVPAYIREADSEAMLEMAIVENVQREALNPVEVALGYQRLIEECDLTQEQVAVKIGKNRATVANMLRLLKLPPRIQASLRDGAITAGHARALLSLEDEQEQIMALREIESRGLSVREVEELVRALVEARRNPPPEAPPKSASAEGGLPSRDALQVSAFCDRLRSRLSTQIQIKHKANGAGGRIEIAYYSDADLERLLDLLLDQP